MADSVKCPKDGCGGMVGRVTTNPKSKSRVGQCLKCGKLVNLGKAEETNTPKETNKPATKKAAAGKRAKSGKQSPSPARRSAGRDPGKRRPIQPGADVPKRGWADAFRDFFN